MVRRRDFYRYFLGFRPDPAGRALLASLAGRTGQMWPSMAGERLHLTLCVIAEAVVRDYFLLSRIDAAFAGFALNAPVIRLGRVNGGPQGALVRTIGRQDGIQDFYRTLLRLLAARGFAPLHRKSGLCPHVTLGHDSCRFAPFNLALEWSPCTLLLIESEVGLGRHNVLGRWPLLQPGQGVLPFGELAPTWRLAS